MSDMQQFHTRHKFSQTYRLRVAWKQDWKCAMCQHKLHYLFEVDHILPLHAHGSNDESNLQALCPLCHRKKTEAERRPMQTRLDTYRKCSACKVIYSNYFQHKCPYWEPPVVHPSSQLAVLN